MKHELYRYIVIILLITLLFSSVGTAEIVADVIESNADDHDLASEFEEIEIGVGEDDSSVDIEGIGLVDTLNMEDGIDNLPIVIDPDLSLLDVEQNMGDIENNAQKGLPSTLKLGVKQKYTIKTSDFGKGKKLTYTSSNKTVVSVSSKGVITALKKGQANITVYNDKKKLATCKLTVVAAPTKVSFSKKSYSVDVNKKITLEPVIPKGSCASYTWSVKDKKIATVTSSGVVQGKKAGKTIVTVKTHNGKKATCTVIVQDGVKAMGWKDFASATSSMVKKNKGKTALASAGSKYSTARLIVKARDNIPDLSQFDIEDMIRDKEGHYLIQLSNDREAEECANYLNSYPEVLYVEPDQIIESNGFVSPNVEQSIDAFWGYSATHSDEYAKDLTKRKKTKTIVVAVVDSGIDYSHSLLAGRIYKGYDVYDDDSKAQDDYGHGTHVSGTIVLCTENLNIKIMPIRVFNKSGGRDGSTTTSMLIAALNYAINNGADVINMSYGGGISFWEDEMIKNVVNKGIVAVAAAGNENNDTKNYGPAHNRDCITVAAVDADQNRASFSNYGEAIDIAAPGVYIASSVPGGMYQAWDGTSMATPFVSAAAAMVLLDNPGMKPSDVESKLRNAATDLGSSGWDKYYGAGFLNLLPFVQDQPKITYTVSYDANGGTGAPSSQTKTEGQTLTLSSTKPEKVYTVTFDDGIGNTTNRSVASVFQGWNTQADGSGSTYAAGASYTSDANATLYAQWQAGTVGTLPTPTRSGYTLVGWYTALYGGTSIVSSTTVTSNMTVYAHWNENAVSDWVEKSQVPANATIVETKTQYRYSDLNYSDWSGWSGWDIIKQDTSDLKKEESATVWYWYRFVCPHCGAHMHVWDKCHTWAGGCGNFIGSDHSQVIWLTTPPSGGVQNWEGTGRIMLGSNARDRWFFWKDASQGYPNGRSETGYRYATRTKSWGNWSSWSDSYVSSSDTRQVETRTMCKYRMN